jgi:hypothetical protein
MADINVTINPAPSVSAQVSAAPEVDVTIGQGIPKHAVTHAPGGSDSLEAYYATTGSLAYVSGLTTGIGSTGYLTGYVSKSETGDFYPSSNPSGFITGVDLSGYVTGDVVRPSQTGDFVTNSQTGNFITSSQTGQFVSDSETGAFYPASNPSGFITGVDLSNYVTGSVVRPSETGDFITSSQTGQFYAADNPSGFITGVDLSAYVTGDVVRPSETGSFITTSQTGQFVADSETGAFYPASNPSGFITGVDLSAYVTGDVVRPSQTGAFLTTGAADTRYALQSQTGNFVTTSQTGQFVGDSETGAFYPASNPSGFITGVDLSNYVTGDVVRPSETGNFVTTSETGSFVTTSQTGQFYPVSNPSGYITGVDLSGYVTGDVVRPSETGDFITESQTGAFYPSSNPSGFITGVDLSSYATTVYVTGVSGHLQNQINNLNNATGSYVTGDVVRPSETGSFITTGQTGQFVGDNETGIFYPASNPSGFITGVDLSAYVTGDVVRPSETGAFLTTGAGDNRYALQSNTGIFVTTGQTGNFVTGSVVRPSETGDFITTAQTGQFVGDSETGAFLTTGAADARYALQSNTGNFITQSQTGQFYAASNPSGFITGVDLSSYATISYVTGVSGDLQNKINIASGYAVTGYNDSITGIEVTGNLTKTINLFQRDGGVLSASFSDVSGSGGALIENAVYTTGNQNISGEKRFYNETFFESGVHLSGKITFNTGFLPQVLDGEASWNNEYGTVQIGMNNGDVLNPVGFKSFYRVKANGNITKGKVVMAVGSVGNSEFIIAQEAANIGPSGELIMGIAAENITANGFGDIVSFGPVKGVDTSSFNSGAILYFDPASTGGLTQIAPSAPNAKVTVAFNINSSVNGTVFIRVSHGSRFGETDSNVKFTALKDNDFVSYSIASGFWYNKTLTTGDVSGINNYVLKSETGSFITTSQTGQFVGDSETGAFLTTGAADSRYALQSATGNFITTSQTGAFAAAANTGSFLTTGAADNRYALQSATGNFITTSQTGAFAAAANTGAFLTTGAADSRYYSLANGQSISGYAITGYNDAVTGIAVTGDTTKTITLFQRDGTTLTANFTDNAGSGSSDTGYLTGYVSKTETGNIAVGTIGLILDGGGSTITTGYKSFTTTAFSGEILSYTVLADRTGSIVIDVWKDTYANYPLTSGDSICATNKVTLATGIKNTDSTLTSWTKAFAVGDNFGFNVDSVSGVQKISLTLRVKKA